MLGVYRKSYRVGRQVLEGVGRRSDAAGRVKVRTLGFQRVNPNVVRLRSRRLGGRKRKDERTYFGARVPGRVPGRKGGVGDQNPSHK